MRKDRYGNSQMTLSFDVMSVLRKAGLLDWVKKEKQKSSPLREGHMHSYAGSISSSELAKNRSPEEKSAYDSGCKLSVSPSRGSPLAKKMTKRDRREEIVKKCLRRIQRDNLTRAKRAVGSFMYKSLDPSNKFADSDADIINGGSEYLKYLYYSYNKYKVTSAKRISMLSTMSTTGTKDGTRNWLGRKEHKKLGQTQLCVHKTLGRYSTATLGVPKSAVDRGLIEQNRWFLRSLKTPGCLTATAMEHDMLETDERKSLPLLGTAQARYRPNMRNNNNKVKTAASSNKPMKTSLIIRLANPNKKVSPRLIKTSAPKYFY